MSDESDRKLSVAIVDAIRSALWPLVALVLVIYLIGPARKLLDRLPDILVRTETVNLGPISLRITPNALPRPSQEVGDGLRQLKAGELEELLSFTGGTRTCLVLGGDLRASRFANLVRIGVLRAGENGERGCERYLELSGLGQQVKTYVADLVTAQLR